MRVLLVFLYIAAISLSNAQVREIPGHLIVTAPTIDGTIDEEEWSGVPSVQGMVDENTDAQAPENSQFWVSYDTDYIYFAARLQDLNPSQIRATEYRTNVSLSGDDSVAIAIDLGGSANDFNVFKINPKGATSIELAGGRAAKREWTGEIYAKGRITESGWEAEARIPWQIFRLPGAGKRTMRINFGRFVSRTQREFQHVNIENNNVGNCPCWMDVICPAQTVTKSIKLLPYSYFGFDPDTGHIFNSGLDLKTQITDQIELVGTINPDFRNIENQVLSLDFSRFERLAGESRPFFQEGSDYVGSALFASQRIDTFDVGFNSYGRLSNKTSFGILNMTDWERQNILGNDVKRGTRNNLIASVTHNPDPTLTIRVAGTSVNRPDLKNDAYLARVSKEFGDFTLSGRQMGSKDTLTGEGRFQDAYVQYNRNGWQSYLGYTAVDASFNPRLGFFPERDFKGWIGGLGYNKNFDKGPLNDYGFYVEGKTYERINGSFYRNELIVNPYTTLRGGLAIVGFAQIGNFEGTYDQLYGFEIGYPRGNPYRRIGASYYWGDQGGLPYESIAFNTSYRTLGKLQSNVRLQRVNYMGQHDQAVLSANYDLGNDRSVSGRLVQEESDTNFYVAFRQSGNLGMEYFVILGDPNARTFRSSLILKVTVPFEIPLGKARKPRKETISSL